MERLPGIKLTVKLKGKLSESFAIVEQSSTFRGL